MTAYRSMQLECPGCGGVMETTTVGSAYVELCPRCLGVWVGGVVARNPLTGPGVQPRGTAPAASRPAGAPGGRPPWAPC